MSFGTEILEFWVGNKFQIKCCAKFISFMRDHMLSESVYVPKELNLVKKVTLLKLMRGPMMTERNIGTVVRPHTLLYIGCGLSV